MIAGKTQEFAYGEISNSVYAFALPIEKDRAWVFTGSSYKGESVFVDGVNPWNFKWSKGMGADFQVENHRDPTKPNTMRTYEIIVEAKSVKFGAGEFVSPVSGKMTWAFAAGSPSKV